METNTPHHVFAAPMDNLDQAATLSALGFPMLKRETIEEHDLGSSTSPTAQPAFCVWEFGTQSADGLSMTEFLRDWVRGLPVTRITTPLGRIAMSRMALHNYRVLRQAAKRGSEVWHAELLNTTRLGNFPQASDWKRVQSFFMATAACSCFESEAAVLTAAGYPLKAVAVYANRCMCCIGEAEGRPPVAAALAHLRDEQWVADPANMDPLAVATCAIRNRAALLQQQADTLLLKKGNRRAVISRAASDAVMAMAARSLNS